MGKDPAIEVRRNRAVINHVAAHRIVSVGGRRGLDDLVIGKDERDLVRILDLRQTDTRFGTIGTDHQLAGQFACLLRGLVAVNDNRGALGPLDPDKGAREIRGTGLRRAGTQERVEILAVDHADIAILDRNIDHAPGGRDHAGGRDLG